jgi:hypothetical protein
MLAASSRAAADCGGHEQRGRAVASACASCGRADDKPTDELSHAVCQLGPRLQRCLLARQGLLCGLRNRVRLGSRLPLCCCQGAACARVLLSQV